MICRHTSGEFIPLSLIMAIIEIQSGDEGLQSHAQRVAIAGPIDELKYPALCPHCGAAAAEQLPIEKVFRYTHTDDTPSGVRITRATPLFCGACALRHRAEQQPPTLGEQMKSLFVTEQALAAYSMLATGLLLGSQLLKHTQALSTKVGVALLGVSALFLLGAYACFRNSWSTNRYRRIPPQTSITRSFDFGDDDSSPFATVKRTYALRSPTYADAFARMNADLDAKWLGPERQRREALHFWIAAVICGLAVVISWLLQAR
ncbi:hypothetical protein [Bradyrhizobium sp. SYSU BS000235]|uniref:hypothetical protein n=1 Tax=Bradyrhizobium sp. SYSU BS000235 TaxID=3411332 RepID=UPI003C78D0EC